MALPNIKELTQYSTTELLDAQAHVWNLIFNFINSMSLKCAIQLGIPNIIDKHNKPITLLELSNALSINQEKSHNLYRLMRILVHSKFFVIVKISDYEEGYWLTLSSRLFLRDEPTSMTTFTLGMLDPIMVDPWHRLSEWFQSDRPTTFGMIHGETLWGYASHEPIFNKLFNEAMATDARLIIDIVLKDNKQIVEGLISLVDVAGGSGSVAKAIATTCPEIKCIVLDLPHVVDGLEGGENLTYVGGDMFKSIPSANAILLKWALECWNGEECVKILENCKRAIPSKEQGGKVIIIDMVVGDKKDDHKALETQLFFDLHMMTYITGGERTEKEWAKLFFDAGFSSYKITPALGLRSIIEVFP